MWDVSKMFVRVLSMNWTIIIIFKLLGLVLLTGRSSADSFVALQNCYGANLCASDTPDSVISLSDLPPSWGCVPKSVMCGWKCLNMSGCVHYNYKASVQQCEFYTSDPDCFLAIPDCMFYKQKNSTVSPTACLTTGMQYGSCAEIQNSNSSATSGLYCVTTTTNRRIQVYCDMRLQGGGYSFLVGSTLASGELTEVEFLGMLTNRTSVLFISTHSNHHQYYGVINQLSQYSSIPLKIGLNENVYYSRPANANPAHLGSNYLYIGFVASLGIVPGNTTNGLRINNFDNSFVNCDPNPSSYMAFFPYGPNHLTIDQYNCCPNDFTLNICGKLKLISVPLPSSSFLFMEMGFGGCGCALMTVGSEFLNGMIGANIGFRWHLIVAWLYFGLLIRPVVRHNEYLSPELPLVAGVTMFWRSIRQLSCLVLSTVQFNTFLHVIWIIVRNNNQVDTSNRNF